LKMEAAVEGYVTGWNDHTKAGLAGTTDNDKRHYHAELAMKERGKFDVGVFHLAYWFASQHTSDGPLISGEQAGGSLKFKLAQEFHSRAHTLFARTANMMRLLAPNIYDSYKLSMDLLAEHHPDFKAVYGDSASCFIGAAIVQNYRVIPLHDSADDKDGVVCMINTGDCEGGDLVVGTHNQQVRLAYLPGDIVMFRSSLLKHGITPFQGRRTAVVLFTHGRVGRWNSEKHERSPPEEDVESTFQELRVSSSRAETNAYMRTANNIFSHSAT
jgi:hypothetical protein